MSVYKTPTNIIEAEKEYTASTGVQPVLETPESPADAVEYELQDYHGGPPGSLSSAPKKRSKMRTFSVLVALYVSWLGRNAGYPTPLLRPSALDQFIYILEDALIY